MIEQQFAAAMAAVGLLPRDPVVMDGRVHAFHVEGDKAGSKNGRYQGYADEHPAGWFGSHRIGPPWHKWSAARSEMPSQNERAAFSARLAELRAARQAEVAATQRAAADRAMHLWRRSRVATSDHPYLARKRVNPYGLRLLRDQLVIPARDADGVLWSLQFIGADGAKKFLTGGRKRGCYYAIGRPSGVLCVCEGYATGASVFRATGHATAIAFDAGNLESVARCLRAKFPDETIVVCADNDIGTPGNPGVTAATAAARAVGGVVAVPTFPEVVPCR